MTKGFSMNSFILGFMLGALSIGSWVIDHGFSFFSNVPSVPEEATQKSTAASSDVVSIGDQPAGSTVIVAAVTVPPPGAWVAVRETNGSDLGNVLGAVRVNGPRIAVSVPLLRNTQPNTEYVIELYRYDGNETFDISHESVYVDFTAGTSVVAYFNTTP